MIRALFSKFIPTMKEKRMICSQRIPILRLGKWIVINELYYRESNMSCNFRYEKCCWYGTCRDRTGRRKGKALTLLMNHYHPVSVKFNPKFVHMTQCMKIIVNDMTAKRAMPKKNTLDYKVMQFQGEVRSPHMYEEKNRS